MKGLNLKLDSTKNGNPKEIEVGFWKCRCTKVKKGSIVHKKFHRWYSSIDLYPNGSLCLVPHFDPLQLEDGIDSEEALSLLFVIRIQRYGEILFSPRRLVFNNFDGEHWWNRHKTRIIEKFYEHFDSYIIIKGIPYHPTPVFRGGVLCVDLYMI